MEFIIKDACPNCGSDFLKEKEKGLRCMNCGTVIKPKEESLSLNNNESKKKSNIHGGYANVKN
jgi:uncharacterized Zn finger protein